MCGSVQVGDAGIVRTLVNGSMENDLGYIIHASYWRRGFGLEAARACIERAREHALSSLVANMAIDNQPSVQLAERLGMTREATFVNPKNRDKQTYVYRLLLR